MTLKTLVVNEMELSEPVLEVIILKILKELRRENFINFQNVVEMSEVKMIPIPCSTFAEDFEECHIHVLNVFIYYILFMKNKIHIFDNDQNGDKFRFHCLNSISHYYLQNHLQIELREFSFLVSVILELKMHSTAHIIYHLVYGRFASQPFIKSLCANFQKIGKTNFKSSRRHINTRSNSKNITPNHTTELEFNDFFQELKNSLDPLARKNKQKRPVLGKKEQEKIKFLLSKYPDVNEEHNHFNSHKENEEVNFVPNGIRKGENSSIMESLPFHKTQLTFRNSNKKSEMRKQKFNFKLKTNYSSNISNLESEEKFNNINNEINKNFINMKGENELAKIGINNVKIMTERLRTQNDHLDFTRKNCNFKKFNSEREKNTKKYEGSSSFLQNAKLNGELQTLVNKEIEKSTLEQKNIVYNRDTLKEKDLIKHKENNYCSMVRLEETVISREQNSTVHNIFTEQLYGWTNENCKKRVQTFKHQFRKFLNSQLFEKIIEGHELLN